MNDEATFNTVRSTLEEQLGVDASTITPESKIIQDIGADSLDVVEIIMELEEEFGIDITDEEAEKVSTVADLVALVDRLVEEQTV